MFTVKGIINNKELFIKWDNEELSGDAEAIGKALEENRKDHGWLGIGAEQENKNYLNYEFPALALISKFVFDKVTEKTNDFEPLDPNYIY
ncbi:MAG: hypothetical protein MJZ72_09830 [Bacteroidales bacterium]|nr:hypothetical protein [Bacteroidales bacterium]